MKNKLQLAALALALATLNSQLATAHAQGALTPPGAPAPMMKSLDQVEARTPLVSGQTGVTVGGDGSITITQPGSYYLTKNLTITSSSHGINVGSQSATIDLNGFVISCTVGTAANVGVFMTGVAGQSVAIRNGLIFGGGTNAGFTAGILLQSTTQGNVLVENVHVSNTRSSGIYLTSGESRNIVRSCSVENAAAGYGILADVVTGCTVRNAGLDGIQAISVSDCAVIQNWGTGSAINTANSSSLTGSVFNSTGRSYGSYGIFARNVSNSYGASTTGPAGIFASGTANICIGERTGGTAINAAIAIGCNSTAGTITAPQKFLGTP